MPLQEHRGYLVLYFSPFLPNDEVRKGGAVRRATVQGTAGDTLFTVPPRQVHVEQGDNFVRFHSIPFGRGPQVASGPDDLVHYAWSDSLDVQTYDADGRHRRTTDIPFEPVPVTESDREETLDGRPPESVAAVENKIPETKPAFDHFLVDDEGRYWFGRPTSTPDSTAWWVATPEDKRVVTTTLPSEVEILTVKDGRTYGRTTTETGAPTVVRYRVDLDA